MFKMEIEKVRKAASAIVKYAKACGVNVHSMSMESDGSISISGKLLIEE